MLTIDSLVTSRHWNSFTPLFLLLLVPKAERQEREQTSFISLEASKAEYSLKDVLS